MKCIISQLVGKVTELWMVPASEKGLIRFEFTPLMHAEFFLLLSEKINSPVTPPRPDWIELTITKEMWNK